MTGATCAGAFEPEPPPPAAFTRRERFDEPAARAEVDFAQIQLRTAGDVHEQVIDVRVEEVVRQVDNGRLGDRAREAYP